MSLESLSDLFQDEVRIREHWADFVSYVVSDENVTSTRSQAWLVLIEGDIREHEDKVRLLEVPTLAEALRTKYLLSLHRLWMAVKQCSVAVFESEMDSTEQWEMVERAQLDVLESERLLFEVYLEFDELVARVPWE